MKVCEYIEATDKPFFSVEISSPLKTKSVSDIFRIIDCFIEYGPKFINVTYHQQTPVVKEIDGWKKDIVLQQRASEVGVCAAIQFKYNIDVVPHLICGGFDRFETEDAIFDLLFLGIENILALRGDPAVREALFKPKTLGHSYASELVCQIVDMANNIYIHKDSPHAPVSFCVGVAGYPEKHSEAQSMNEDIKWLKHKVDSGAKYIVTQMFYDFDKYVSWERKCRDAGITVPIIPGIKPITKLKQIDALPEIFHITVPGNLADRMRANPREARQIGIDYTIELSKKLLAHGVPAIHYFSMSSGKDIARVVREVFSLNAD
ncbi:MAG: methylenetetrahydrofolate reductase [Candidatus Cloacimonetes bacterium]|nr:methylenetetrahydrofolate reductase [Candidatus Cloacimonadota bacterium]